MWQCPCSISSVQFSHSVMSDSLHPHRLQQARLPCPSPSPRACSNSCPLSQWCNPTISSSVVPFSFCLQSFPASFPMSRLLASRWPRYWSCSFSISSSNEYLGWISFRIDWFDLLAVKGTSLPPQFESIDILVLSLLWPRSSYFPLPLATGNHHSIPCFYEIDFYFLLGSA